MKRVFGRLVLVLAVVLGATYVWTHYHGGDTCSSFGAGVADASAGDCPTTVAELARDSSWARRRIQELATQPETTGKLYFAGPGCRPNRSSPSRNCAT